MKNIYSKLYLWLFIGLLVTFLTGAYTASNKDALSVIFTKGYYWIFALVELGVAIFLSVRITKMSATTAKVCYLLYTFLTGLTFSTIFIAYKLTSIIMVFGITSVLFLGLALVGMYTKKDLTKLGSYLFMALIGILISIFINVFLHNSSFDIMICIVSVIIFLGYIAYDINKISKLDGFLGEDNLAIFGAFQLYLDFINVFIDLLRLFGDAND